MVRTDHNAGGGAAAAAAVVPQQPPVWFEKFYRDRISRLTVIARAAGARTNEAAGDLPATWTSPAGAHVADWSTTWDETGGHGVFRLWPEAR